MVMKLGVECEQMLIVSIEFDDGTVKSEPITKGDYVSVAYNFNGTRRVIDGTVKVIYANPYNGKSSKKDWYIIVANDNPESIHNHRNEKIAVLNILDIQVITSSRYEKTIKTPSNGTRVTTLRVYHNVLQVSQDNGRTWLNVGALTDDFVGDEIDVYNEIQRMIGSDQYSGSDEFIRGIVALVDRLVNKERAKIDDHIREYKPYPPVDPNKPFLSDPDLIPHIPHHKPPRPNLEVPPNIEFDDDKYDEDGNPY